MKRLIQVAATLQDHFERWDWTFCFITGPVSRWTPMVLSTSLESGWRFREVDPRLVRCLDWPEDRSWLEPNQARRAVG